MMLRPSSRSLACRAALLPALLALSLRAQTPDAPEAWSLHGQATAVTQGHGSFASPYQGPNSFPSTPERATSFTTTLMGAVRLWPGAEAYADLEGAAGRGVGGVLGLAGAPNGETARVGSPAFHASVARAWLRQTLDLGGERTALAADAHQLGGTQASRRLVLHLGRFSVMDVFDGNTYAHDPRTQFLNWTLMAQGAWDYPADVRGYTWGAAAELHWDTWALRAGRFAEPVGANQPRIEADLARSHGDALEVEHGHTWGGRPGLLRALVYRNLAPMGDYRQSLAPAAGVPDLTATRQPGRGKRGWGLHAEQGLTEDLGAFARWGWNDGRTETWAFTEVDRAASAGLSLSGRRWGRARDQAGLALAVNGLSPDHRTYLAAGGQGFLLGDGRLAYALERALEAYYAWALGHGATFSLDLQRLANPGCNRDRGPMALAAARLHAQF